MYRHTRFKGTFVNSKKSIASWLPFWLSVESRKFNQVISIVIGEFTLKMERSNNYFSGYRGNKIFLPRLWPMTLGKKKLPKGLNVSIYYEFNLLDHVCIVAKGGVVRRRTKGTTIPSGPNGPGGKNDYTFMYVHGTGFRDVNTNDRAFSGLWPSGWCCNWSQHHLVNNKELFFQNNFY